VIPEASNNNFKPEEQVKQEETLIPLQVPQVGSQGVQTGFTVEVHTPSKNVPATQL